MLKKFINSKQRIFGLPVIDWLFVLVGLVVFTMITLWTIAKSSIWFDEAFGAYLIHFNFFEIARYTSFDVHPPLFYWLLKLWSMVFGNTELALRSMSTFFGGIAVVFGYLLTNRLFGKKAARVSLIFIVLSPMLIRYGQEARMYMLVTTIALAATYVLTYAINTKKKLPWVVYGILVSLGMWTHYFSAVVWIAHWIWRADNIRRSSKKGEFIRKFFSREWILAHVVAIGLFIPWLPFFVVQLTIVQAFGFWIPPVTPDTMTNFLTNAIYYLNSSEVTGWLALAFVLAIVLLAVLAFRIYKSQNKSEQQNYRLIIALAFVPMFVLFLLSMPPMRSYFIDRYLISSVVGIALFIGVTLALGMKYIKPKWRFVPIVILAALMVIGVGNVYRLGNYNKNTNNSNNARQIIEAAVGKASDGQPIIAATPWFFYEATFYDSANNQVYFIAPSEYKYGSLRMLQENNQYKIKDIVSFTKANPIFWYIGTSGIKAPYSNWVELQEIVVNDSVSGKPAYKAIQYKITN